jgi:hypothetical protein
LILTIRTTHRPATDLGFLLHKNPSNVHEVDLSFGKDLNSTGQAGPLKNEQDVHLFERVAFMARAGR